MSKRWRHLTAADLRSYAPWDWYYKWFWCTKPRPRNHSVVVKDAYKGRPDDPFKGER